MGIETRSVLSIRSRPLNTLFFTAGIEDEGHGLFGTLTAIAAEQLLGNGR